MPATPATAGWRVLLAGLLLAVCWLAFDPRPPPAADTGWDKANHLLAFAVLAFCAERAFAAHARRRRGVATALLAYGVFIEAVQTQIPGRSAELADLAGNAAGIALGLLLAAARPAPPRR